MKVEPPTELRSGATGCLIVGTVMLLLLGILLGRFIGIIWNPYFTCTFIILAFLNGMLVGYFRRPVTLFVVICVFSAVLLLSRFVEENPTIPFGRFYNCIQTGMTENEVVACLHRAFPEKGRYKRPIPRWSGDAILLNLDLDDGRYNAEVIQIDFRDSRVVSKDYRPD